MRVYPPHAPAGIMLDTTYRGQFNIPNAICDSQMIPSASCSGFDCQLQRPQHQHYPSDFLGYLYTLNPQIAAPLVGEDPQVQTPRQDWSYDALETDHAMHTLSEPDPEATVLQGTDEQYATGRGVASHPVTGPGLDSRDLEISPKRSSGAWDMGLGQAQDIHRDALPTHSRSSQIEGETIHTSSTPAPLADGGDADEEVAVFQKDWGLATFLQQKRGLPKGEIQPHSLGTVQPCKRKCHSESSEVTTAVASQHKRARTEKREGHKATLPGNRRTKMAPAASECGIGTSIPLGDPEVSGPTSGTPADDETGRIRTGVPTPTTPALITSTSHFGNPAHAADDELTITKVNLVTPASSPSSDNEVIITRANIVSPPPSVSPQVNNLSTSTRTARVPSDQFSPKTKEKSSGRTTTYTRFVAAPYDVSRANKHLAHNMPLKIAMNRKRWITNPDEFPGLERRMGQGAGMVGGVPDESDERGKRVLPVSIYPQGNSAIEAEAAQSEKINPYEGSDNELSWQGSGELIVEEGETHGHQKTPPAAVAPTSPMPSLPKKGRRVKLTEEEKKARRRQRDRERYKRKKEAAAQIPGTQMTPQKKLTRRSPAAQNNARAAKRTLAKTRYAVTITPPTTPHDESEGLVLAQHRSQEARRKEVERGAVTESGQDGGDGDFDIWVQLRREIQNLPPVDRTAEDEMDEQPNESLDEDENASNGGFDIWEQLGLEVQNLPLVDRAAELQVCRDAEGVPSVGGSNGVTGVDVGEAGYFRGDLPFPDGDNDYINSLFDE